MPRGTGNRRGGFTLLELLGLLFLLALFAGLAIPYFYSRPAVTLDSAAVLLARDLRAAQNTAVVINSNVSFEFHADGGGYRAFDAYDVPLLDPGGGGAFVRRYGANAVFEGVEVTSADFVGSRTLHYDSGGFALQGGTISLAYGEEQRTLRVELGSGLIEIDGLERHWTDDGR